MFRWYILEKLLIIMIYESNNIPRQVVGTSSFVIFKMSLKGKY